MSGEIVRWLASNPVEREHDRSLDRIDRAADRAQACIGAVVRTTQTGLLGVTKVGMDRRQLELMLPEASADFEYLARKATFAIGDCIDRLAREL